MRSRTALRFSVLFFLSGATALVYELLWVRLLYQAFGSTIQSVTTVVAAYMGGLGLGAWLLGRRADRHPRPAALYGALEIAIGVFAVVSPLVLALALQIYVALASGSHIGPTGSVALRFGLAALVLLVPTTLMGGTLPVLTRALAGVDRAALPVTVGRLYGINTLGAVTGTALAGLVLVEHVGIRASLWGTALVNVAIGLTALRLLGRAAGAEPALAAAPPAVPRSWDALRVVAVVLLGATAFAALLDEIAWTRVLVLMVGASTYAFTLILLTFLLGIGLGSRLVARAPSHAPRPETAAAAGLAQGITAAGAALLFLLLGLLPGYIVRVFHVPGATARLVLLGLPVAAVVLLPAIGMGMTFPLLTDLVAREDETRGGDVGWAYALNTIGSIAGAALTGFVLVVWLGSDVTLRLGLAVNGVAALALAGVAARGVAERSDEHRRLRNRVVGGGLLAALALAVASGMPRWSTRLLDLGPAVYGRTVTSPTEVRAYLNHTGVRQLAFREGWNATVSVWESGPGRSLKVNGKADASDQGDMDTEVLLGLAPVALHPEASSGLVIGFGSGVTTRTLSDVPGMRRVRVVEIEPAVLDMARYFLHVNDTVLARPAVSVAVDDARSALQIDTARYDVIVSEPSNPWLAGVATLYTPEFFEIVRSRLAPGGVFCQWVQLYQLPLPVVAAIVRNVHQVFPHTQIWFSSPWDLMVAGSADSLRVDPDWLARLLGPRGALGALGREYLSVDDAEDYLGHLLLGEAGVARLIARADLVHRDDRPGLEFVAARRFLDSDNTTDVFDSLVTIGRAAGDGPAPERFGKALLIRRGDPIGLRWIEELRAAHPGDPLWTVQAAAMRLNTGDSTLADSALPGLAARGVPDALLLQGLVAARRNQVRPARDRLREAVRAGSDTALAEAALAALAARDGAGNGRWTELAGHARAALAASRNTLRHPFPRDWLGMGLSAIATDGPAPLADSLLAAAQKARPSWPALYEMGATAALRRGRCDEATERLLTLLEFGIERADGPARVERCRRGLPY
jgi:spermidine synthase